MKLHGFSLALVCMTLAACGHPGLATEPPQSDAADPNAEVPETSMPPDVFSRSAFEGQNLKPGGHHHHHHQAKASEAKADDGERKAAAE